MFVILRNIRNASRTIAFSQPSKAMLWEGEPLPAVRKRLEGLGVEVLVYDPCSRTPSQGDFMQVMAANVDNLAKAWR